MFMFFIVLKKHMYFHKKKNLLKHFKINDKFGYNLIFLRCNENVRLLHFVHKRVVVVVVAMWHLLFFEIALSDAHVCNNERCLDHYGQALVFRRFVAVRFCQKRIGPKINSMAMQVSHRKIFAKPICYNVGDVRWFGAVKHGAYKTFRFAKRFKHASAVSLEQIAEVVIDNALYANNFYSLRSFKRLNQVSNNFGLGLVMGHEFWFGPRRR